MLIIKNLKYMTKLIIEKSIFSKYLICVNMK